MYGSATGWGKIIVVDQILADQRSQKLSGVHQSVVIIHKLSDALEVIYRTLLFRCSAESRGVVAPRTSDAAPAKQTAPSHAGDRGFSKCLPSSPVLRIIGVGPKELLHLNYRFPNH